MSLSSRHSSPPLEHPHRPGGPTRPMSISTISMPPSYHTNPPHPSQQPLTRLLMTSAPQLFSSATQHTFLRQAGLGTLPKPTLSRWVSQDRVYAQAYINFIGALLARLHLPHHHLDAAGKSTSLRWRILTLLTNCLTNIRREIDFFDSTAAKYNLKLDAGPKEGAPFEALASTKQFEALFRAFGSDSSMTLLDGLVVLWATETCYLHAWRYARSFWPSERSTNPDRAVDVLTPRGPMSSYTIFHNHNQNHNNTLAPMTAESPASSHYSENPANGGPLTPVSERAVYDAPELVVEAKRDSDGGALREAFIPNWTSKEFGDFVDEIGELMDELYTREEGWRRTEVFKAVWEHVLSIEKGFWPNV